MIFHFPNYTPLYFKLFPPPRRLDDLILVNDASLVCLFRIDTNFFLFKKDCLKSNAIRKLIKLNLGKVKFIGDWIFFSFLSYSLSAKFKDTRVQ